MFITAAQIAGARALLAKYLEPTPLVRAGSFSAAGKTVYLKNEAVLPTGSFKVRGAIYALSAGLERHAMREVVAASTGNHGAAVAYAARLLGVAARIFLPRDPNPVKVSRIREYGATLVEAGGDLTETIEAAAEYVRGSDAYFLHDAEALDIPIATATIGAEVIEQLPALDAAYIPMGDTALIRGVASALKLFAPRVRVVGVVAERAPAYFLSWRTGEVVETASALTIADGLAVRRPLVPNVAAIRELVDEVVTVSEDGMLEAIRLLRDGEGILAEPSGAAAMAAVLKDKSRTGICVALVTGGNISPEIESRLGLT